MRDNLILVLSIFSGILIFSSCESPVPKPNAMLRLQYPKAVYESLQTDCPYSFKKNKAAVIKDAKSCQLQIEYPFMKATLHLTYRQVSNNIDSLLIDAQKLTYEHVMKADDITEQPFLNSNNKVYGMLYEIGGNAASQSQFYVTDSTKNFLTGALYFYAKPNYDSILPAVDYVKNDMRILMESLQWNNQNH